MTANLKLRAANCGAANRASLVWSPDYDGKSTACVRFNEGTDAIVGGSRFEW